MVKKTLVVLATLFLIFCTYFILSKKVAVVDASHYTIAFLGDQGNGEDTQKVLDLVKSESADALVLLGDYDYENKPESWYSRLTSTLGSHFPLMFVIGNHEEEKLSLYVSLIQKHLALNTGVVCEGEVPFKAVCRYKNFQIITMAPGIKGVDTSGVDYSAYVDTVASSSAPSTFSTFCGWHKNQRLMQLGDKVDEVGWEVYHSCNKAGFPIMSAHEHSYARSFVFSDIEKQVLAPKTKTLLGRTDLDLIPEKQVDELVVGSDRTFVVVSGLGGKSIRPQAQFKPWWSKTYSATNNATYGALFCTFDSKGVEKTFCYFKDIKGKVVDVFYVKKN